MPLLLIPTVMTVTLPFFFLLWADFSSRDRVSSEQMFAPRFIICEANGQIIESERVFISSKGYTSILCSF